jgi:hypothetical protein
MSDHIPTSKSISVRLGLDPKKSFDDHSNTELASAMDTELTSFNNWFTRQGNERLTGMERSILRTYLAWKLLYEEGDVDPQT